jgi:hypothetical protein
MSYLGRHARASAAREIVWEIIRATGAGIGPFTVREFCQLHKDELERALGVLKPGASTSSLVKGALQSLTCKGLLSAAKAEGDGSAGTYRYSPEDSVTQFRYGRAMIEAQRLRLL